MFSPPKALDETIKTIKDAWIHSILAEGIDENS